MNTKIESLTINGTSFEVVYREPSNRMLLCNPPRPVPDRVWKEIWGIVDGRLQKLNTIEGKVVAGEVIPERIEF